MSISITIGELRDYMIEQVQYRNFHPSFICYAVESYIKDRFNIFLDDENDRALGTLSEWFGYHLESGYTGTDPNFTYGRLFGWMNLGYRVVDDLDLYLPGEYDVFDPIARMLCRIGMLTWLMESNGIPGDAEIVIVTEE